MRLRPRLLLLSLFAVVTTAIGFVVAAGRSDRPADRPARAGATVRAMVVPDPPPGATVVEARAALDDLPVARALVEWAARTDARDEWVGDVVEGEAGRAVVETLHDRLPHYRAPDRADAHLDGVYVHCDGKLVVLTAAGWSLAPEVR